MRARGRSARGVAVLVVLAMLMTMSGIIPAFARSFIDGGIIESPAYVMNDHTPFRFQFGVPASAGLEPDTEYQVKLRIGDEPDWSVKYGYISAENSGLWTQENDDTWNTESTNFPVVTTDGSGVIEDTWMWGKVGNENLSGNYYLIVSLTPGAAGNTRC
ncbi:MAG: hypothetical protein JXE06_07835 [Coriobacteriia bacterium]|nr:hypothetical protein [Coriobacteriia bacterium]MBN2822547.1 hypothetical protein [Coriobacteriia bacterium]